MVAATVHGQAAFPGNPVAIPALPRRSGYLLQDRCPTRRGHHSGLPSRGRSHLVVHGDGGLRIDSLAREVAATAHTRDLRPGGGRPSAVTSH
eukprot:14081375-Heterocapsa_arctica.AAC.1